MTTDDFLLGSFSLASRRAPSATVLNNPALMKTASKNISTEYESDEMRWSVLMVNAQAGDESDYRQLLTELTEVIYSFLRSRFGNHHFVEDCVQESLIAIHQARHTYDQNRPFRPWLFAIVRHKAIDTLRKQQTRQKFTRRYIGEQETLSRTNQPVGAESEIISGRLFGLLSSPYREVLLLTKIIGFSVAEAAEKLDISESLVKVRVHRAIHKLKQLMEADKL